ncbi:hypothetical protein [Xylophilus sp. GOD-11R]|uniref:hypothetical protein n=1 Tax=Xylophilus sp. GOD-11R TaxID=3089814 RepID=UPI00298C0F03|nr:hypothetical protein [Xylophilus sp. GOD-11R]WPB59182.1 hypothetical protein R9X41_11270 [Xylophilus sp. GOD-11R]
MSPASMHLSSLFLRPFRTALACAPSLAVFGCMPAHGAPVLPLQVSDIQAQAPTGKPRTGPVKIAYDGGGRAAIGQPHAVTFRFSRVPASPPVTVSFSADEGVALADAQARTLPAGESSITIVATPSARGRKFVNVFTRLGTGGTADAFVLQVGAPETRPQSDGSFKPGSGERPLHLMQIP